MSFYKKITVPLPKFRVRKEKYGIDEPSCFINSNRVPKHNDFPRIDFEEIEKKKAQQDKAQQDKVKQKVKNK